MERCNIGRRWLTPNIGISGITAGISHLFFSEVFILFFQFYHFPPHKVTIYITDCITWCFKFIVINLLNQWFLFFGCLDNTFITQSIWSFIIINTFITYLKFRSILFIFVIIISILCVFQFCNRIISTSMWLIVLFIFWSISRFRIIIIFRV